MNVVVKKQKDYSLVHGLPEIIYPLAHFSNVILFFLTARKICVYSVGKRACLSAFFSGKKFSAAYLRSKQSPEG